MAEKKQVYKCSKCGNIIEVLRGSSGVLFCCGQPMLRLPEKTADSAREKHVPVIEKTETGYKVTVGSSLHPMEKEHYIEWIELLAEDRSYIKYLNPGDKPEAEFCINAEIISAREHCNKHGFWKGEI